MVGNLFVFTVAQVKLQNSYVDLTLNFHLATTHFRYTFFFWPSIHILMRLDKIYSNRLPDKTIFNPHSEAKFRDMDNKNSNIKSFSDIARMTLNVDSNLPRKYVIIV